MPVGFRSPVLDVSRRAEHARPSARPLERRDAGACESSASASCRVFSNGRSFSKTQQLCDVCRFDDPEWEFLSRLAEEADCGLLLDVNNVYVSSVIMTSTRSSTLNRWPHERVVQYQPGRSHRLRHALHRHARRPCRRSGLGALCPRARAHRPCLDVARMGREHPRVLCRSRRSQESKTVLARSIVCTRQR